MDLINKLLRDNIRNLTPYSSARDEYQGSTGIFLDANENPFGPAAGSDFNRYPDPHQRALKAKIAEVKSIHPDQIFLGNGSDEAIDLLFRAFCKPGKDKIILLPPTYGMYGVCAKLNDVEIVEIPLTGNFQPDVKAILGAADENTKLVFLCSPNNPTGNLMDLETVAKLAGQLNAVLVVDEAYIDFADSESAISLLDHFPNLVILQTFSKAWGLAGLRLGMAVGHKDLIRVFDRIKPPYNVNAYTQQVALEALTHPGKKEKMVDQILNLRNDLEKELTNFTFVEKVFPSQANFLLTRVNDANHLYQYLINEKVIIRNRSNVLLCDDCVRITVGTPKENYILLEALKKYDLQYA